MFSHPGAAQLFEIRLKAGLWLLKLVSGPLDLSYCVLHTDANSEMLKNYRQEPCDLFLVFFCARNNELVTVDYISIFNQALFVITLDFLSAF